MLCNSFNKKTVALKKIKVLKKNVASCATSIANTVMFLATFFSEKLYIKFIYINSMTAFSFRLYLQLKHIAWYHKSSE